MNVVGLIDSIGRDLRGALRSLPRRPAFAFSAVVTVALGIGASTLIYSVIEGVLLKPLPYPDADRIVRVFQVGDGARARVNPSDPNFADLKEQTHSFAAFAQYNTLPWPVVGGSEPIRAQIAYVSKEFFDAIGVDPSIGRRFVADELHEGAAHAVIVSHRYWQRYLGSADLNSRTLRVGEQVVAIVGVMPPGFEFPSGVDLWAPRELVPVNPQRTAHNWLAVARLAPGVSLSQARDDASAVARRLKTQYGDDTWMRDAAVLTLQDFEVGSVRPALLILGAAVALLLLVACANVASMLLAQAIAREQEVAVRVALGAGRGRLAGQFLAEMFVLCGAGGVLGFMLASWGVALLTVLQAGTLPRANAVHVGLSAAAFASVLVLAGAVTFSLLLARRATRSNASLANNARGVAGARRSWAREGLVAAQAAIAVVLLVAAVLLGRSFMRLIDVDPGFRSDNMLLVNVALPRPAPGADTAPLARFHEELLGRVRALPGVESAGGVTFAPLANRPASSGVMITLQQPNEITSMDQIGALARDPARAMLAEYRVASEDYFGTLGIPLLRGRAFELQDGPGAEHVAVVSRSLAELRWPGEDPLGKLVQFGNMDGDLTPFRVVGVVGDVREFGLDAEPRPTFYGYYRQRTAVLAWSFWTAIRAPSAEPLIPAVREIVHAMNPDLVPEFLTGEQLVSTSVSPRRFNLVMLGVFGATALLLALAGVYGAVSFNVAQRTREIGVRVVMGAHTLNVVAMVLRRSLAWVAAGIGLGLLVALATSRVVGSLLFGISAHDPIAFGVAAGALLIAALAAASLPAMRAARVDPLVALRSE